MGGHAFKRKEYSDITQVSLMVAQQDSQQSILDETDCSQPSSVFRMPRAEKVLADMVLASWLRFCPMLCVAHFSVTHSFINRTPFADYQPISLTVTSHSLTVTMTEKTTAHMDKDKASLLQAVADAKANNNSDVFWKGVAAEMKQIKCTNGYCSPQKLQEKFKKIQEAQSSPGETSENKNMSRPACPADTNKDALKEACTVHDFKEDGAEHMAPARHLEKGFTQHIPVDPQLASIKWYWGEELMERVRAGKVYDDYLAQQRIFHAWSRSKLKYFVTSDERPEARWREYQEELEGAKVVVPDTTASLKERFDMCHARVNRLNGVVSDNDSEHASNSGWDDDDNKDCNGYDQDGSEDDCKSSLERGSSYAAMNNSGTSSEGSDKHSEAGGWHAGDNYARSESSDVSDDDSIFTNSTFSLHHCTDYARAIAILQPDRVLSSQRVNNISMLASKLINTIQVESDCNMLSITSRPSTFPFTDDASITMEAYDETVQLKAAMLERGRLIRGLAAAKAEIALMKAETDENLL